MQHVYVFDIITKKYRSVTYGEVKQALLADIAAQQGPGGYQTTSAQVYERLPEGIVELNPQSEDTVSFSCEYVPLIVNGLSFLGVKATVDEGVNIIVSERDIIRNEIGVDPLLKGYAAMTNEQKLASLNTKDRLLKEKFITARTLLAELDPLVAATIYGKFIAAAAQNPVIAMAVDMLKTYSDGGGIDICHPNTLAFIGTLSGSLLTAEEVTALQGLALTTRAKELIGRNAVEADL